MDGKNGELAGLKAKLTGENPSKIKESGEAPVSTEPAASENIETAAATSDRVWKLEGKTPAKGEIWIKKKPIDRTVSIRETGTVGKLGGLAEPHPEGVISSWTHFEDDPHDSFDIKVSKKTPKSTKTKNTDSAKEDPSGLDTLNKPVEKVKEGDVSSITSKKVVYGGARTSLVNAQEKAVAELKEKQTDSHDSEDIVEDLGNEPAGPFSKEAKARRAESKDTVIIDGETVEKPETKEITTSGKVDEKIDKKPTAKLEQAKEEWRSTRDLADKLEAEYTQKYEKHVLEQARKWRTLPRRMLGIQPWLPDEMLTLKNQADTARARFHFAANKLLNLKDNETAERLNRRLFSKVTAVLPSVYQQREESQKRATNEAWGESKYLRPTLETLNEHKYTLSGLSIGAAVIAGTSVVPILAAIGAGMVVGKGSLEILKQTYVAASRKNLKKARENIGTDYWRKSYADMSAEMEHATFNVAARETRAQAISAVAGLAAGIGTGIGTNMYINGLETGVNVHTPDSPPAPSPVPNGGGETVPNLETPTTPPDTADVLPKTESKVSVPLKEMGDASVAEAMHPKVEAVINDIESGVRTEPQFTQPADVQTWPEGNDIPVPEPRPEPPVSGFPDNPPVPEPRPELGGPGIHDVKKGDIAWHIVKDESAVLKGLPLTEQNYWQVKLWDSLTPQEAIDLGFETSHGDVDKIYPGDKINVSGLDDKIRELMAAEGDEYYEDAGSDIDPQEPVSKVTDMNDSTLQEANAVRETKFDLSTPEGSEANQDYLTANLIQSDPEAAARVASSSPEAVADVMNQNYEQALQESLNDYVRNVEQPRNNIFDTLFGMGKPNIEGTLDQMKDLSMGQLRDMVANDNLPAGVSDAGFDRWWGEVAGAAANDNERFGDVVARVANGRTA